MNQTLNTYKSYAILLNGLHNNTQGDVKIGNLFKVSQKDAGIDTITYTHTDTNRH